MNSTEAGIMSDFSEEQPRNASFSIVNNLDPGSNITVSSGQ
jgi:hypothetical protein